MPADYPRVGYVLKRYPRYSETFIVNEILAHERAGLDLEIFSLRPANDTFFAEQIAKVRAPVTYLPADGKLADLWTALDEAHRLFPEFRGFLHEANREEALVGCQAMLLACHARRHGIHHLHAHFATAGTSVARLAARLAGVGYSFTAHAKDIFHDSVDRDDLSRKLCDANAVVTVSDFNVNHLSAEFPSASRRLHRIYNGLELDRFPFTSPADRPPRIVGIGRLVEKKGFDVLIDACAELAESGRRFDCRIIGEGDQSGELSRRIAELNLAQHVRLMGAKPTTDVIDAIRSASVVAVPCVVGRDGNRDGLPTVLLEAMALGTPCVSTDVTGIPEVIRDGVTGLMVPQRDSSSLATAIARLIDDAELRVRLAIAGRRLIEQQFDIDRNTACIRELFHSQARLQEAG